MRLLSLVLISLFCKPGTLTNLADKHKTVLKCPATETQCYFDINLPFGDYQYVSEDQKDTVYFYTAGFGEVRIIKTNTKEFSYE